MDNDGRFHDGDGGDDEGDSDDDGDGCHFSEVCKESEDCIEDNLFGTCVSPDSVSLPFYDVSRNGFRDLKIVIRFLLDRGYQWRDDAAQKTLEKILDQYRMEYVDPEVELEVNYARERELELEALENMAAQYGSLFFNRETNDRLENAEEMKRNYGIDPAYYTEEEKVTYLPQNKVARGTSKDEVEDLIQQYVQAIENSSPRETEEEAKWMYHEYYQKYLDLLEQYRAIERAAQNELAGEEDYGEESPDYYAEVREKLDYLKQYLEEIYQGELDKEEEEEEEEETGMEGNDEGMVDGGMSQSSSSWWEASSSSISEGGLEEILEEGIDRLAVQLINNELIPQMTPQEQEQWRRLNEDEKEGIIQEALQAIDWVAMEMETEGAEEGQVQREMVAEAMEAEEEEAEKEAEEEAAIEAAMKDGEWLNEGN
ncbi:cilia- and flagella-associated protein 251-like [Lytechinus pictus]|uniref:cilia- and flagella-associated protein 251-like n=1 Tax=Lytechinus pictus TaxID=7653 RepID=UPI0030B9E1CE